MLILYVHAHMHVGTRVWLAPTCEWVWYTLEGKGREGEKSEERRTRSENGRSLFQRTLRSSTARSPSKQDTQWQRWQRWQWWQWWVWRTWSPLSLSLSLLLLSSPLVVVDTMVKSLSSILALFSRGCSLRLVSIIENHPRSFASFENWRFQFCSVRREIILGGDFFSRERDMIDPGIFRQWSGVLGRVSKRFRLAAPELAVMPTMDGFEREKNGAKMWSDIFFCGDSRFAGNRVWKFVGETDRSVHCSFIPFFFFFVFFNLENNFVRVIEKWFYRERERKR